ncbi:MAG: hypothetical protein ACKVQK_20095 [Burkholderiales bacterium]
MENTHWMLFSGAVALGCLGAQHARAMDESDAADAVAKQINALSPANLGYTSVRDIPTPHPQAGEYLGGSAAAGRVAGIYLKLAPGVFISFDHAPQNVRYTAERWVEVQFPEALGNGLAEAPAYVGAQRINIEIGDAVEIRFAHPLRTRVFPLIEVTRVTAVVAKNYEPLAREIERRILGRRETNPLVSITKEVGSDGATVPVAAWLTRTPVIAE